MNESNSETEWLGQYLADLTGAQYDLELAGARSGGMSHRNVSATSPDGPSLIIRLPPPRGPLEPYDISREARMIQVAAAGRIPVPDVLAVEENSPVGPLMVMRRVQGTVLRPGYGKAFRDGDRVGEALVTMLARIHAVSFDDELAEISPHTSFGASLLDRWWPVLVDERRHHVALDAEALGLWLGSDVPSDHSLAFLHGDYRLGNLMWASSEVAAVLDWETSSIGNPLFDLAWLLMGTSDSDDLVMGVISRRRALDLYVDVTGTKVDEDELVWWELLATWCRVCMEVKGIRLAVGDNRSDLRFLLWEFGHRAVMASAGDRVLRLAQVAT